GLSRPLPGGALPVEFDNQLYTIMSSNPVPSQAALPAAEQERPATPMLFDIQAMQIAYGPNMTTRTGDDVYFAPGTGNHYVIERGKTLIATIWDAGGIDTFSGANQTAPVKIDLRPGKFSTIGKLENNVCIALGIAGTQAKSAIIENAKGGSGGDLLTGNNVANGLEGGGGNDSLYGGVGEDSLFGGGGNDLLRGGDDRDWLYGGGGADRLFGDGGDDILKGGPGADEFVMTLGGGTDRALDFADGYDRVNVAAFGIGFADLRLVDVKPGTVRVTAGDTSLLLVDPLGLLTRADLTEADFVGLV
ncbi:MAG TPA: M10 family metallopeptidase C-terminal domain-containing protein, partial [Paracoccaceae bacterium]|nr:M10 family metallopeptidase C-terminal domain-containing protein [Paracoccaceae bacterium]